MFTSDLKLILRLYPQPSAAMSDILDQGNLWFSTIAVILVTLALGHALPELSVSFYEPLLVLALFYVPGTLIGGSLVGRVTGFNTSFQRDFAPLLTCAAAAWTAANTPLVLIAWFRPELVLAAAGLAYLYFAVLMFFAVRVVFGTDNGPAIAVVFLSPFSLVAAYFLWGPLHYLLSWLASPFVLFYAFYFLRGEFGNLTAGLRRGQSYRRNLEAAAINPHDGEAQYQLGLIFQQRRQYAEAIRRFTNAITIDPTHTDAHFQLGRIARDQGRLKDALGFFQTVVIQDERHSQSEILRELGALYIAARQYQVAERELAAFLERHPYDSEGLFYYGQALKGLGRAKEAVEAWQRSTEAASLAPAYIRRNAAKWSRLARKAAKED